MITPKITNLGYSNLWTDMSTILGYASNFDQQIQKLFSNGEQGFAYDPNDLTTLYQDATGTIPVTASGQPVGLMMDKSKGLALGSELTNAITPFTVYRDETTSNGSPTIATLSKDKVYMVEVDVTAVRGVRGADFRVGGQSSNLVATIEVGRYIETYKAILIAKVSGTLGLSGISSGAITDFTVSRISVKEIAGNHAYQTVSASRPLLGRHPVRGIRNLVRNSYDANSSNWGKSSVTITPVGLGVNGNTCYNVNPAGGSLSWLGPNIVSLTTGQIVTTSFYAKKGTGAKSKIIFENQPANWSNSGAVEFDLIAGTSIGVGTSMIPVRDGWYRCSVTRTVGNTAPNRAVLFVDVYGSGVVGNDVNISDVQVEVSATATTYQTVHSVTDITEAGVTSTSNLYFDGTDDFLQTNNIDFTTTDKVSLFAGVRKLSDAAAGMLIELSSNASTTSGTFGINAPDAPNSADYLIRLRGGFDNFKKITENPAPITTVISARLDAQQLTVNNKINVRLNGITSAASGSGTPSTTQNFIKQPLYIGRRGGTSLPFNGHIYGLIGIGRLTTGSETIALEKAIAKNVGVTLNV